MILTLDIAFRNMGWATIHSGNIISVGIFKTEKSKVKTTRVANDYADCSEKLFAQIANTCTEYTVQGIIGELPVGGAKSARAHAQMNMAISIVACACRSLKLPREFCTPAEVKLALTNNRSASKTTIQSKIRSKFGLKHQFDARGEFTVVTGTKWYKSNFEHIADAIGAYLALKDDNLVRIFG